MRVLITGICGFVGSTIARALRETSTRFEIIGVDNLSRPGSERNRTALRSEGISITHADIRAASDIDALPPVDWVLDAAANPTVLAGVDGRTSSRQLVEHNLWGTINLLEYCRRHSAGFVLLSTSRVYSIPPLASLAVEVREEAFHPVIRPDGPVGLTAAGVSEAFSTISPVSLYGATKIASESMALEYGETFGFPVFINRCGVMAGAGQFGRPDQGIFAYWLHSCREGRPLKYIGFDGQGHQVRDCLHPRDLIPLLLRQFEAPKIEVEDRILNLSGGLNSSMSLRQLTRWCEERFGNSVAVASEPKPRAFDIPWMVLDSSKAERLWDWRPETRTPEILEEIACFAEANPHWLEVSAG